LFGKEDYHAEKAEAYEKLLKISTASMSGEEKEKHQAALREAEVVPERSSPFADRYDQAVYTCLRQKMNRFAYQIEKMETNNLITR
jgi:hypothetical protein